MTLREEQIKTLLGIQKYMPQQAERALKYFVELNPNMQGAQWADVLDNLIESDSHLDIIEDMYEYSKPYVTVDEFAWFRPIILTLTYSNHGAPPYPQMVMYWMGYISGRREREANETSN